MPVMSKENRKCKRMLIFNLPAGKSCRNSINCRNTCYARKAEYRKSCRYHRQLNYDLASTVNGRQILMKKILDEIGKSPYDVVRIHESGDFFSQEYVDMWTTIIKLCPDKHFYAFTKVLGWFHFEGMLNLPNMNLINSFLPGGELNYGDTDHLGKMITKYPNYRVCQASAKVGAKKCNIDCTACTLKHAKAILFKQH